MAVVVQQSQLQDGWSSYCWAPSGCPEVHGAGQRYVRNSYITKEKLLTKVKANTLSQVSSVATVVVGKTSINGHSNVHKSGWVVTLSPNVINFLLSLSIAHGFAFDNIKYLDRGYMLVLNQRFKTIFCRSCQIKYINSTVNIFTVQ